ncbi:hypothetical protein [Paenibacillus silvae]|uniref:Uncharacterized protein n=1 Tax=Paenibacillus silvae TaxID=1325358 RepID=A0A2W6NPC0_9BACL|nr:hypothetical protein [Paenibacillus silvae]PZT57722.1 hypothetical protein DN757_00420 [Paenibacillus silvae]
MSMNIHWPKGTKVRFCNRGGWDGEYEQAAQILKHGEVYVVRRINVYQSSSEVFLEGFKEGFNSVLFEDVYEVEHRIDYGRIRELTNVPFTEFIKQHLKPTVIWRNAEHCFISIDDFQCDPFDPEVEEIDDPVVVVDVKFSGVLYTFWYNTGTYRYDYSMLGENVVNRYLAITKGHRPYLPGIYTYSPSEEES